MPTEAGSAGGLAPPGASLPAGAIDPALVQKIANEIFHDGGGLADAVLISDVAGRVAYVNRAYTRLTGFEPRDVVGRTLSEVRSGPGSEQIFDDIWRTVARSGSWHGRFTESCKDGSRVAVWASMSSVKDRNGLATHYVWTISGDSKERAARLA